MPEPVQHTPPEGGWGWVVSFAAFWTNGIIFGLLNSYGVLLVAMLKDPILSSSGADAFNTAWVGSIAIGLTFLLSPIASISIDRFGCRKTALVGATIAFIGALSSTFVRKLHLLYLTFGVVLGTGFSFAYTPSLVILVHYFKKKFGLANGVASAGSGIFSMTFPLLLELMEEKLGLWTTIGITSGFVFTLIPVAATYSPLIPPRAANQAPESNETSDERRRPCVRFAKEYLNIEIWKKKRYVIWSIALPIATLGHFVKFVHLVNHVENVSSSSNYGAIALICLGATSLIGRLFFGRLADKESVRVRGRKVALGPIVLQQISLFVDGFITMLLPFATLYFPLLIVLVLIMGLFDGCFVCMLGPVAKEVVGPENASQAIGFILGLIGITVTVGPPIAGFLFDSLGSYYLAFIIAGVPALIAACIMFLMLSDTNTDEQANNEGNTTRTNSDIDMEMEAMLDNGEAASN